VKILKKHYSKQRLKKLIESYNESDCVKSLAGLALYLGVDRLTLTRWQADSEDGYAEIISYAKTCIEKDIVENGLRGKYNATMASFILKTSFGYRDKGDEMPQGAVKIEVSDELREFAG
jgi:hypothetical protein